MEKTFNFFYARYKIFVASKIFPPLIFLFIFLFFSFILFLSLKVQLPSEKEPLLFYSNQTQDDLRLVFKKALKQTQKSAHITMYSLSDPFMLKWLENISKKGISTKVFFDPSAGEVNTSSLIEKTALKTKGLMHKKIVILDKRVVFLGSANMTTASLKLHDNLTVGIYNPKLAHFLEEETGTDLFFSLKNQNGRLLLLPDSQDKKALHTLINTLDDALFSIQIAMFTLTHPLIVEALIRAKQRGVNIEIAIDYFTARGACKKAVQKLKEANIPLIFSRGQQLLHHKWALIDGLTFIMGSTNWTAAAFKKNHDCLLFLHPLLPEQQKYIKKVWKAVVSEGSS